MIALIPIWTLKLTIHKRLLTLVWRAIWAMKNMRLLDTVCLLHPRFRLKPLTWHPMFVSLNCALSPICNDVIQVGSIRYCAPELLTPDNLAKYNEQADVYVGHLLPAENTFGDASADTRLESFFGNLWASFDFLFSETDWIIFSLLTNFQANRPLRPFFHVPATFPAIQKAILRFDVFILQFFSFDFSNIVTFQRRSPPYAWPYWFGIYRVVHSMRSRKTIKKAQFRYNLPKTSGKLRVTRWYDS